ncbi:protein of unknown function [Kyrpidia spormannii]|uniref:Uncharacterized protein n=1 Tax=Kyrpidia spormannii TaxID=2055160 RepID=A0A6F9EGJ8_9BACL|nr:protein of unknown function [Kyrpidia spormannii]
MPMRNGNRSDFRKRGHCERGVRSVPMRNGNHTERAQDGVHARVRSVPMRNGNLSDRSMNCSEIRCS